MITIITNKRKESVVKEFALNVHYHIFAKIPLLNGKVCYILEPDESKYGEQE